MGETPATKAGETVVIGASSFREKLGLESEPVVQPDKEIAAFRSSIRGLKSALALGEQIAAPPPEKLPAASQWKNRFELIWDEQGGFHVHGTHHPTSAGDPHGSGPFFRFLPTQPGVDPLESPSQRGVDPIEPWIDDGQRIAFGPVSRGRTPDDFYDYPDSTFVFRR